MTSSDSSNKGIRLIMNTAKYKNKYVSILGDSISTFEGISEPKDAVFYDTERKLISNILTVSDTWWGQVIEKLGAKLLVNNSISGSTVSWQPAYEIPSYGCSDERTSALSRDGICPDVVIVYLGTNDWGAGVQLAQGDNTQKSKLAFFSNAYSDMLEKIHLNYPQAEIWCVTLSVSCFSKSETFKFPFYRGKWHMSEYCDVIRTCAIEHNCKIIDLFNTIDAYDTIDGFHPNNEGMKTIAEAVIKLI